MRKIGLAFILVCFAVVAKAEDAREFRLSVPAALQEAGLIGYLLPRFALKTGRRAEIVAAGADVVIALGSDGTPAFARGAEVWAVQKLTDSDAGRRFADWLLSDIGLNTVTSFAPATGPAFSAVAQVRIESEVVFEGDAVRGFAISKTHCGRCHRVVVGGTGIGIGSTPSFMAIRALPDWADRFGAFYALNPHPSFMLVEGISPAFNPMHPPALVPVTLTQDEVEAVQAYVSGLAPANLGAAVVAK